MSTSRRFSLKKQAVEGQLSPPFRPQFIDRRDLLSVGSETVRFGLSKKDRATFNADRIQVNRGPGRTIGFSRLQTEGSMDRRGVKGDYSFLGPAGSGLPPVGSRATGKGDKPCGKPFVIGFLPDIEHCRDRTDQSAHGCLADSGRSRDDRKSV
jgi:hypothetical protein